MDWYVQSSVRAEPVEAWALPNPFGLSLPVEGSKPGWTVVTACLCSGRRPGVSRRASNFLSRRLTRKSPKKGRPRCLRPRRCAPGQPAVLVRGARCGTRCAPAALRSNSRSESVHEACVLRHTPPHTLRSSAHTEGMGSGHPFGPSLRSAPHRGRTRLALGATAGAGRGPCRVERSDDPCGCLAVLCPTPFWLRLRRGCCGVAVAQVRGCFVN